jgi:hypothetical protein
MPLIQRFSVAGARPSQHVSKHAEQLHLQQTVADAETACEVASKRRLNIHEPMYQYMAKSCVAEHDAHMCMNKAGVT